MSVKISPNQDDVQIIEDVEDMEEINAIIELGTTLIKAILEKEPMDNIRDLIDAGAPLWFQDNDGTSPLHAAAYVGNDPLVKLLIDEGAVWSAVDNLGNTAGDIALSMNNDACYTLVRDTGIRAELLRTLLSSKSSLIEAPSSLVISGDDHSAVGSTDAFLAAPLHYVKDDNGQDICLLKLEDGEEVGIMMGWEREIMRKTVDELCLNHPKLDAGLRVLNVGFGLGMIDTMFQSLSEPPSLHVIVEPHPDVLTYMDENEWYKKAGVKILKGKWQDVLSSDEFLGLGKFDVVYTDTFAENYDDLYKFFKRLPAILDGPNARFSFFNGLGATNALFYDVYTRVSDCHLTEVGADADWYDVEVGQDDERWGETRKYFTLPIYRLPIARLKKEYCRRLYGSNLGGVRYGVPLTPS